MSISARRLTRRSKQKSANNTVNLLTGRVFSSSLPDSSTEPGNVVANITDGNTTTRWISQPSSPVNLTADLGAVYDLSKITVVWAADTIKNYTISVSSDASSWTTIAAGVTNNTLRQTIDHTSFSGSARGQYLRITGTDRWDTAYGNSIWEVSAYGSYVNAGTASGTISSFSATPSGTDALNLSWNYTGSSLSNFILKRGGTVIATLPSTARSYNDPNLTANTTYTYTLTGTFSLNGASTSAATTSGTTSSTPSGGGGAFSGLAFPSLLFKSNGDLGVAAQFESSRGRPLDGVMSFSTYEGSWDDFRWIQDGAASYVNSGHFFIWAIPHAPATEGRGMNANGAANAYRSEQVALGQWLVGQGLNSPNFIVRLDWEFNGDWYNWSSGSNPGDLKQALINCVTNMRAGGLTQAKFDLCANSGSSPGCASFEEVWPGKQYFDIISVDSYDWDPPALDAGGWSGQQAQDTSVTRTIQLAAQYGVKWALDEGGNCHNSTGGGDNPYYWQRMWELFTANAATCHHHMTYDDPGAPSSLRHDFSSNPDSWAYYKRADRWGG